MKFGTWIHVTDTPQTTAAASAARQIGSDGLGLRISTRRESSISAELAPTVCLAADITITGHPATDRGVLGLLQSLPQMAKSFSAPLISFLAGSPSQRPTAASITAAAETILPLAQQAAQQDIRIAVQNSSCLPKVRDLWTLVDRCQHPAVACCWDASEAARFGEGPSIGVPVLNSRIALVSLRLQATVDTFEQGDRAAEELIHRLRGIGYTGYVLIDPGNNLSESSLAAALAKLRKWNQPYTAPRKASHTADAAPAPQKKAPASPAGAV